jgi:hypothetical protein
MGLISLGILGRAPVPAAAEAPADDELVANPRPQTLRRLLTPADS